jgi:hypothetical protein
MPDQVLDDASALGFGRLLKNMAIGRSGVYLYTRKELTGLGIHEIPDKYAKDAIFSVYRPAAVLAANLDKFASQPLTDRHPQGEWVTPDNSKRLMKGWGGDSVTVENSNDEIIIRSSVNLVDRDVIKAYDSGVRDVSPGYIASFSWREGETKQGERYQIVMDDIESVNHLALVPEGRGGPTVRIMDSGDGVRKLTSGLFKWVKNLFVLDAAGKSFREVLNDAIRNRDSLTEDDFDGVRDSLSPAIEDIPESTEKLALKRMVFDLWSVKKLTADGATKYATVVSDLYEKLDKQSSASVVDAMEGKVPDEAVEDKEMDVGKDPGCKEVSDEGVEKAGKVDADKDKEKAEQEKVGETKDAGDMADKIKAQGDLQAQGGDGDNQFNDNDIGTIGGLGKRIQQLERAMTQIAVQMETFGTTHKDGVPAHQDATKVANGRDPNLAPNVSPPTQISDAAPVIEQRGPFTATLDSKVIKTAKGVDLEAEDRKISNGGKK